MTDALFDVPETLSPSLAWIRKHKIITHYSEHENDWLAIRPFEGDENKSAGEIMSEYGESALMGFGDTEDEAIASMAQNIGLPLWNEEQAICKQWMREHGITTKRIDDEHLTFFEAYAHDPLGKLIITVEENDEESALLKLAEILKIKDWRQS